MVIKNTALLILALMATSINAKESTANESNASFSVGLLTSYSQAADSLQIDGKSASFKTGGVGLKLGVDTDSLGLFYTVAGGGYLPKQSASFAGAVLTGPADSLFYGVGYSYKFPINNRLELSLVADYVSYDIKGDLEGEAFSMPVTADVDSEVTMFDTSISMHYAMSPQVTAVLGAGLKHWTLEATADGLLGNGIRASTSANASNTDPQYYLGAEFSIANFPVGVYYRRSTLKADSAVALNGLDIHILLKAF